MHLLNTMVRDIRSCRICESRLPLGPRPVLQVSGTARILVAAQAPGTKVHATGIPFNDPSGDRLRTWMGVDRSLFYNADCINIVPMGFCYPGRAPKGGDNPPDPACRKAWHDKLFGVLPPPELTLVIGQYAQSYHLGNRRRASLTETVKAWRDYAPQIFVLPHPSPRNNIWLKRNPWFEDDVIPVLQNRVREVLDASNRIVKSP